LTEKGFHMPTQNGPGNPYDENPPPPPPPVEPAAEEAVATEGVPEQDAARRPIQDAAGQAAD
jgi:hypothetical protein